MASQKVTRAKDLYNLMKSIDCLSAGQARVMDYDCQSISYVTVELTPSDGIYSGGTFVFQICLEDDYPDGPPKVLPLTKIYHPNIKPVTPGCDESGDDMICVSIVEDWDSNYGLQEIIQALLFLLYNPNRDDPLNGAIGNDLTQEEFERNVKVSLGLVEKHTNINERTNHENVGKNEVENDKVEDCYEEFEDDEEVEYNVFEEDEMTGDFENEEDFFNPWNYDCDVKWEYAKGQIPQGPSPTLDLLQQQMGAFNYQEDMEMDNMNGAQGYVVSEQELMTSHYVPCVTKQYSLHPHLPCVSYSATSEDFVNAHGQHLYKHYDIPMVF